MSVNFPPSPSVGQTVTDTRGVVWRWTGDRWSHAGGESFVTHPQLDDALASIKEAQSAGGFVNQFRNAAMDLWVRSLGAPSFSVTPGSNIFTADGWRANTTGGTCIAAIGSGVGYIGSVNAMVVQGGAGVTAFSLAQRIEGLISAKLAGRICTFQATIRNNTGAPITPQISTYYPNALDNWATLTTDFTAALQTIPVGATRTVAINFLASDNAVNGYGATLIFGAFGAGQYIGMTGFDLRQAPTATLGLNDDPPPPELRNPVNEQYLVQRYYSQPSVTIHVGGYADAAGRVFQKTWNTTSLMRGTPTITGSWSNTMNTTAGSVTTQGTNSRTVIMQFQSAAAGWAQADYTLTSLNAEL